MNRIVNWAFLLGSLGVLLFGIYVANAQTLPLKGEVLALNLSVCLDKKDAIEIIKADQKHGLAAANAVWESKPGCANVDVVGPTEGNVVYEAIVTRDEKKITVHVIEIVSNGEVIGYFMSSLPLPGRQV